MTLSLIAALVMGALGSPVRQRGCFLADRKEAPAGDFVTDLRHALDSVSPRRHMPASHGLAILARYAFASAFDPHRKAWLRKRTSHGSFVCVRCTIKST